MPTFYLPQRQVFARAKRKKSDRKRGRCAVHVHRSFACELVVVVGAGAAGIIVAFVVLVVVVVVVVGSVFCIHFPLKMKSR